MELAAVHVKKVKDDEHIDSSAYQRYLSLAHKVNSNVKHILYSSTSGWHHADDFFRYPASRREFIESVFN